MRVENHLHIRHIMLYHFEQGWRAAQSFRDIVELFGEEAISQSQVERFESLIIKVRWATSSFLILQACVTGFERLEPSFHLTLTDGEYGECEDRSDTYGIVFLHETFHLLNVNNIFTKNDEYAMKGVMARREKIRVMTAELVEISDCYIVAPVTKQTLQSIAYGACETFVYYRCNLGCPCQTHAHSPFNDQGQVGTRHHLHPSRSLCQTSRSFGQMLRGMAPFDQIIGVVNDLVDKKIASKTPLCIAL